MDPKRRRQAVNNIVVLPTYSEEISHHRNLNERDILQQFQKPSLIFINGHTTQLEFKELFHLSVIVYLS
jgi:hypothetical protein